MAVWRDYQRECIVSIDLQGKKYFGISREISNDKKNVQVWIPIGCVEKSVRDDVGYNNTQDIQWLIAYVPKEGEGVEVIHQLTLQEKQNNSDYALLSQFYPQHFAGVITYWRHFNVD